MPLYAHEKYFSWGPVSHRQRVFVIFSNKGIPHFTPKKTFHIFARTSIKYPIKFATLIISPKNSLCKFLGPEWGPPMALGQKER